MFCFVFVFVSNDCKFDFKLRYYTGFDADLTIFYNQIKKKYPSITQSSPCQLGDSHIFPMIKRLDSTS